MGVEPPDPLAPASPDAPPTPDGALVPDDGTADGGARQARARHRDMLLICAAALLLSALLGVRGGDGRVTLPGLPTRPLPPLCLSQQVLGVKCPGCGLTRSFIHLAHGRWDAAWHVHRLGWLLFAAAALQIPYRLAALYLARPPFGTSRAPTWFAWTLIALLIGNWALEMLT